MNLRIAIACTVLSVSVCGVTFADKPESKTWYSKKEVVDVGTKYHFKIDNKNAYLIEPEKPLDGNPWIWRARFPTFHAEMDKTLIKRGFHLAYLDVANEFGCPTAVARGEKLYDFLVKQRGMNPKPAMEGVSRGGLFVYNYAAKHPGKVACIYCDTPVCDFLSWPGGNGTGVGSERAFVQCLKAYGLTQQTADQFKSQPIDNAKIIADAKIPLLHIVSDNDKVVPPVENTDRLRTAIQAAGHKMDVIRVAEGTEKSKGHHFTHPKPQQVVEFIWKHARGNEAPNQ